MANMGRIMEIHEKVYVVLGNEMQEDEGLLTLNWVIKNWASHNPISIVLFYIISSSSTDFVLTPLGKLPASAVSNDLLQIIRKREREKIDKLLSGYVAFCGKVNTEIHTIEKHDEPIQNTVVELIMEHRITKLVMGVTFIRSSSSGRSKSAIRGSFYVHRKKPEFCDLYILCRGKLMILKEENEEEGHIEDEQGVMVAKMRPKASFKGWLGKMLSHGNGKSPVCPSSCSPTASSDSNSPMNQWDRYEQEIDEYSQELLVLRSKSSSGEVRENGEENCLSRNSPTEQDIPNSFQDVGDRIEALNKEIKSARRMIELNKNEAKAEVDRQAKASWAICLCNHRAEELESHMSEEISIRNELTEEIDSTKVHLDEILTDVQESKSRLSSLLEVQSELSAKLRVASLAKEEAEAQLGSATSARAELVRQIEELRKQRDVFNRRIEFCKEKDAIGMATRMSNDHVSCSYREFSVDEIRLATDNFAAHRRLKSGGDWTGVYKGRIKCTSVAVMMLDSCEDLSQEVFQAKVNLLGNIRHPNITGLIGYCSDLKCLIFEYMHNGCLKDVLFSRRKGRILQWHHRIQIAAQVSSGLGFLHSAEPRPIVHGGLNPSTIFLDRNFVAKIHAFQLTPSSDEADVVADVGALGVLLLQLLTGRNWAGLDQESVAIDKWAVIGALDENAGDWPLDLAEEVVGLAMKCRSTILEGNAGAVMSSVIEELKNLKKVADDVNARKEYQTGNGDGLCFGEESSRVPNIFLCPILQVVMENPHIAADGYSYEFEAIDELLGMGHDTSPITNLKLIHKHLTPNITLRLLIQDWHNKKSRSSR